MQSGDTVTYPHYGQTKSGVISHMGKSGLIVFLRDGRWLHRTSVLTVNGKPV